MQTPELGAAGDLFLGRVALSQRHGDELADDPLFDAEPIQPGLFRDHDVVLWWLVEPIRPAVTGHRIDFSGRDLDRERVTRVPVVDVVGSEVDPHRLGLVHRQHHATMLKPVAGHGPHVVVDMLQGERSQASRQWIIGAVIRDPQRALKLDFEPGIRVDLGKTKK